MKTLRILGIRGVPAAHGGFETFAEHLALHLQSRGWRVVIYCQAQGKQAILTDHWQGIERVHLAVSGDGALATMKFDAQALWHAAQHRDVCLTLGYNTALFNALLRLKGVPNVINMDGIEWARAKWGRLAKAWLWANDWIGCWVAHHLVADNPAIKTHLMTRVRQEKITMIPYGARPIDASPEGPVRALGLSPGRLLTVIARPEPENSLLEIVQAFSAQPRGYQLAILGAYQDSNPYHRAVKQAASSEVVFLGAIYDPHTVQALRFHSVAYIHGHQVGGTNPSLVEAMGANNAVIAHDNRFNRWVAGPDARYFDSVASLTQHLDDVLTHPDQLVTMGQASRQRFEQAFTWPIVLQAYEQLLASFVPSMDA
jgi:glycosyltransferase involved in cell wall biosynthesis